MLAEARQVVPEEGPEELSRRLRAGEQIAVIDVRDPDEYRDGHIEGATNISRGFLEFRIGAAVTDPKTPMVVYCQSGLRSVLAAKSLRELGYTTDRKSTRLNSSHSQTSYAVFCLKKKKSCAIGPLHHSFP